MRKFLFVVVLLLVNVVANAQAFNNEWIDYSKTYYKFKVGRTGVYRITATSLNAIGLANQHVESFQLWRNGKEVALYTSNATGPIGAGFIEFWGEQNDGVADKPLYRTPDLQQSNKISLQTDTAAFFLTLNTTGNNLRFNNTANNVAANALAPEPYFIYSLRANFRDRIHRGYARPAGGEYLYSSSYDIGEFWSTGDIMPGTPYNFVLNNLAVAATGPAATFRFGVAGSAPNYARPYRVTLNNIAVVDSILDEFRAGINYKTNIALSAITSNTANISIFNNSSQVTDRIVASFAELNYPRQFNFNNQTNFSFTLQASSTDKYLEITNFNAGGAAPVLYDLTNRRRYEAEINSSGVVRIVIQPSSVPVDFVLVSEAAANIIPVTSFTPRTFINYTIAANRGEYLIISNAILHSLYSGADQVEQYRAYRASVTGGSYNAKIYDIEQLVDQYAFGIKKHPLSIKNFMLHVRRTAGIAPKYVFLMGKGVSYDEYRYNESSIDAEKFNLVPTWGYPASDVLLISNTLDPIMSTPVGRLSAVTPVEVADYLDKVKQYEQAQQNSTQTVDNKAWMKTVVHVAGGNDANLDLRLTSYLRSYQNVIEDTLFGGKVTNFNKTSTGPVTPIINAVMDQTFQKGMSLLTYFGHSSASSLDYNLDDPYSYNNQGKYPIFVVNGCNAGNLYSFEPARFSLITTLSEKWVLAKNRGSVAFIASTHFGLENYLDYYTRGLYKSMAVTGYGKGLAENIGDATNSLLSLVGSGDFFGRIHSEETALHGDPAIRLTINTKPDYDVEEPQIKISPSIVSAADDKFSVKAFIYNLGKATGDSVQVQVKRQYPDGTIQSLLIKKLKAVRYIDSFSLDVPIIASRDKGENKIIVSVDDENRYAELSEINNMAAKTFNIFEDELRPVFPYNFGIVSKQNIKLSASTANPVGRSQTYLMELDTTELFNSTFKVTKSMISIGGLIEFDPGVTFSDSTVYYWRVAPSAASNIRWNSASFVYLNGSSAGYNQSHFYQHTKSTVRRLYIDSTTRKWKYANTLNNLTITNSIYPTSGTEDNQFSVAVNGSIYIASTCDGPVIQFNVFDPVTFKPWKNIPVNGVGMNGSVKPCSPTRDYNFDFLVGNPTQRQNAIRFMDSIPNGFYVVVRNIVSPDPAINTYAKDWQADANIFGANNSLYDRLVNQGFNLLDSFYKPRAFGFVYRKNGANDFRPAAKLSEGLYDRISLSVDVATPDTLGFITSPKFGPAVAWKQVKWRGKSLETTPGDVPVVSIIGVRTTGKEDTLYRLKVTEQDFDISSVSSKLYPFIKLSMRNADSINITPYQLNYWRILYEPVPEGALAPSITYRGKDTLEVGEKLDFAIAFKNISDVSFADSMKVKMILFDKNNVPNIINIADKKKLIPGDTITVSSVIDTKNYIGNNTLYVDVNPDLIQPEQYRNNNFLYKNFFVKGDTYNPLMDVTFDGIHILNGDIVAAKPKIVIKLKDDAKFLALDDTSLATVFIRYPGNNNALRRFSFGSDTLRFIRADLTTGKNEATIEFNPFFMEDSNNDYYELIVRAKDKSGNNAGTTEYKVRFQVFNKPMISNMFNYPNPFTTSTAFVFTITGSEIPQNLRIQILTVTGKIVKDITKEELGSLHIGRNITDYKWDGTDQYGQKLGNGIYLYRVITNLNGNSLDKFNTTDENGQSINTDKYFNKGYGKMYLMR